MTYKIGNFSEDAGAHRGWFIGTFMEDPAVKTDAVEVKYWHYNKGPVAHDTKISSTYECTLIIAGSCKGVINGTPVELHAGEYYAVQSGISNNIPIEALEPVTGITIKAPSDPSAKKVIQ